MKESESKGKVYYLYSDRNFRQSKNHIQQEIAYINAEMAQVEQELQVVKSAGNALDQMQLILARMREIAVEATNNPQADRVTLSAELERCKEQIDEIATTGLAGWSQVDAIRLKKIIADMGKLE